MAFGRQPNPADVPLTNAQKAERHIRLAEEYLAKSKKATHVDYHIRLATVANTHATLGLFYQNADPSLVIVQDDAIDDEMDVA